MEDKRVTKGRDMERNSVRETYMKDKGAKVEGDKGRKRVRAERDMGV